MLEFSSSLCFFKILDKLKEYLKMIKVFFDKKSKSIFAGISVSICLCLTVERINVRIYPILREAAILLLIIMQVWIIGSTVLDNSTMFADFLIISSELNNN